MDRRPRPVGTAERCPRPSGTGRWASCSSSSICCRARCFPHVSLPLRYAKTRAAWWKRRPGRDLSWSGSATRSITVPCSCPAASSSASPSPAHSSTSRGCCWPTSRRARSTRRPRKDHAPVGGLNRQGNTIVLVTHEMDVASHARRRILLRDGAIVEDVREMRVGSYPYAEASP